LSTLFDKFIALVVVTTTVLAIDRMMIMAIITILSIRSSVVCATVLLADLRGGSDGTASK